MPTREYEESLSSRGTLEIKTKHFLDSSSGAAVGWRPHGCSRRRIQIPTNNAAVEATPLFVPLTVCVHFNERTQSDPRRPQPVLITCVFVGPLHTHASLSPSPCLSCFGMLLILAPQFFLKKNYYSNFQNFKVRGGGEVQVPNTYTVLFFVYSSMTCHQNTIILRNQTQESK